MPPLIDALQAALPPQAVLTEREELLCYGFDGTAGLKELPLAVVFAQTTEQVSQALKLAAEHKAPVVCRGSGTGLSGGSVPVAGGIVLCLLKMNRLIELDPDNLTLHVEAGMITQKLGELAAPHGLFYPPDPSSMKVSTIGGNVANNSGGLRGLKYGVTRNYVMALRVVLADGSICWLGNKCVKDVAGFSLKDVFIGSEGTLGIITEVMVRLAPIPASRKTLLAHYADIRQAAETVSTLIRQKIIPCTLEFLDQATIQCIEDFAQIGLPRDVGAILLMETDGHEAVVEAEAQQMADIARASGATVVKTAADQQEALQLASARRSAFAAVARIQPTTILEDVTVPRSALAEMVVYCQEVAQRHNLRIANFGHMGDGNLHPTFLTNEKDHEEMERVEAAMGEIFDKCISLGGTITGEHGVGLAKKPYLDRQFDHASMALLRSLKSSLDPLGLLNPGKIFDLPEPVATPANT
jgi:glycolate oxidase